jgi:hypothetical protein
MPSCWLPPLDKVMALVGVLAPDDPPEALLAAELLLAGVARRMAEFIGGCDTRPAPLALGPDDPACC